MKVQILAVQADEQAAHQLSEFLTANGCEVQVSLEAGLDDVGETSSLTVALWSLQVRLSPRHLALTNAAILADAAGNLAVGHLDDHPLPIGLSNLQSVDLRFDGMRKLRFGQLLSEFRKIERSRRHADTHEPLDQKIDVFVSHSENDLEIIEPLISDMRETGATIWNEDGAADNALQTIEASHLVCVMCSAHAYASDDVRRHLTIAKHLGTAILPVLLDGATMPEDIEFFLGALPALDMTGVELSGRAAALRNAIAA